MEEPLVSARTLSRRFGARWALARVDLDLHPGERLLIAGANGSGKTTLLRILATLMPPTLGELRLFGRPWDEDVARARARIGLVSHQPSLYEDLSGAQNIAVLLRLLGRDEAPEAYLERVGLERRPDPVRVYSAGMRKRLSFARLLAQKPALALLDEPYGTLDPSGFLFVDGLIQDLSSGGAAVIMASHLVQRAGARCDRAILLDKGQVRWTGAAPMTARAWGAVHGEAA